MCTMVFLGVPEQQYNDYGGAEMKRGDKATLVAGLTLVFLLVAGSIVWADTIELDFWFSAPSRQVEFMEEAVAEYNELNPHVRINLVETPPGYERIATALAAGMGPDLFWFNQNIPWFFGIETVYPINDFVKDPEIGVDPESVFPWAHRSVHYGGVVQALPVYGYPGTLIYNRQMFAEAGLSDDDAPGTWEEVTELALKFTEWVEGRPEQWGMTNVSVDWHLQEILLSNSGDWVDDELTRYIDDPAKLIEGLQWWHDMIHVHEVMPVPRGVTWVGAPYLHAGHESFIQEEAAMAGFVGEISFGVHAAATMIAENPDLDLGAVLSPLGPSSDGTRKISTGYGGIHVMADTADPLESYLFAKWFFEEKSLDYVLTMPGAVPANVAGIEHPVYMEDPLVNRQVLEIGDGILRNFHVFPGRLDVRSEEPTMAESVVLGIATPEEAVETFLQHAEEVFALYREELDEFKEAHVIVW